MTEHKKFVVSQEKSGQRLDIFLKKTLQKLTRNEIQALICDGKVSSDFVLLSKSYKVKKDEIIEVELKEKIPEKIMSENIPLEIVYEDEFLLVVNKPKGMVVHPTALSSKATLVNALLYRFGKNLSDINGKMRPGILHRIDKDTSGLLLVAKKNEAHEILAKKIANHDFLREYLAVVHGVLKQDSGVIEASIGRSAKDRKKMAIREDNSKYAYTEYEVIERFKDYTYVRLRLKTGRTHQIRVHMAGINHPVAGDKTYGPKKMNEKLQGQCLHAYKIGFNHPITSEYLEFSAPAPEIFKNFLEKLRNTNNKR